MWGKIHINRGRVGEERRGKETDRCPLTIPRPTVRWNTLTRCERAICTHSQVDNKMTGTTSCPQVGSSTTTVSTCQLSRPPSWLTPEDTLAWALSPSSHALTWSQSINSQNAWHWELRKRKCHLQRRRMSMPCTKTADASLIWYLHQGTESGWMEATSPPTDRCLNCLTDV
jgi:hypothetical protein